jgi:stearoyl-CoA desaturase (Delta-9 desaturase)
MSTATPSFPRRIVNTISTMLIQWWDSEFVPAGEEERPKNDNIDSRRVMPFIFIHAGCLAAIFTSFSWWLPLIALALYYVRMFAITAFYHRYFSHRSFKTSRAWQFVMAVWGNTSMQRGPLWWASHHRHHHAHSDEEPDVHSPTLRGFLYSHIGWITRNQNYFTDYSRVKDFRKHPEIAWLNRHDMIVPTLYGISLWVIGAQLHAHWPALGITGGALFVWGFFISTVMLMHGTFFINSLAHVFGSRRFKTTDTSRNSLLLALITLGEGWHNNHHRFQFAARQGFYWWEIDISFYALKAMSWVGLVWDLRAVPPEIYAEAEQAKLEGVSA